jgi:RNA polymerase sigma factor (sigma-70 family)
MLLATHVDSNLIGNRLSHVALQNQRVAKVTLVAMGPDVFVCGLRALRGIGNFADGDARSWVLTIVRRTAYDWLNRNRPEAIVLAEDLNVLDLARLPEPDAGTAESCWIEREDKTLLENAIAALPAHYRHTLALRHLQGLTYPRLQN